jgi:hypothetical protein
MPNLATGVLKTRVRYRGIYTSKTEGRWRQRPNLRTAQSFFERTVEL